MSADTFTTIAVLFLVLFAPPAQSGDCSTDDAKGEAILDFIEEHYPPAFMMISGTDRDTGLMEVYFHPYEPQEQDCEGKVRVDDECRITDADGNPLNRASRERVFQCTLSSG